MKRLGSLLSRLLPLLVAPSVVLVACGQESFNASAESHISGWTGIDARSLVSGGAVGYLTLLRDTGQGRLFASEFTTPVSNGDNKLTAVTSPGSYFALVNVCGENSQGDSKLYEAKVVRGSHAAPIAARKVEFWDDRSGELNCSGSSGTG